MEINLRKANAIQAEIRKAISAVKLEASISVTEYTENISNAIVDATIAYQRANERKVALTKALYNIRNSVANANATVGINTLLGNVEALDQEMAIHSQIAVQSVAKPLSEVIARVEKLKTTPNTESRIYGDRYNMVETSVVTQNEIDVAKARVKELKRARQALQDKLLSLNVNTLITITGADEALLQEEGIL
jgi:polyhydroxyalkanoate synthesis regulator phasin